MFHSLSPTQLWKYEKLRAFSVFQGFALGWVKGWAFGPNAVGRMGAPKGRRFARQRLLPDRRRRTGTAHRPAVPGSLAAVDLPLTPKRTFRRMVAPCDPFFQQSGQIVLERLEEINEVRVFSGVFRSFLRDVLDVLAVQVTDGRN